MSCDDDVTATESDFGALLPSGEQRVGGRFAAKRGDQPVAIGQPGRKAPPYVGVQIDEHESVPVDEDFVPITAG